MSALSKVRGVNISKDTTRRMEDEARKMELKMEMLRKTLDGPEASRSGGGSNADSGSRWRSGTAKKPIRSGYVKDVLESKPGRSSHAKQTHENGGLRPRDPVPENGDTSNSVSRGGSGQTTPTQAEVQGTFAIALAGSSAPTETSGGASSNLKAALRQQSREALEVEAFLAALGLDRYVSLFMEHGFDCMEVVQEMQESHMRDIGMATGHALKLRKRLAELNPAPTPMPAPPAATAGAATQSGALSSTAQKRVSFGCTEEAKVRSPGNGSGGGSLLDGHFDEEEQKASFQEAVRAWREGRAPDDVSGQSAKGEAAVTAQKAVSGSFWSSVGANDVNIQGCGTSATATTSKTSTAQSETQHDPAPSEEKLCCYQCYKQFFAKYAVERSSPLPDQTTRRLCSDVCANLWAASMEAKVQELQQRHEKLAKLEEMRRAIEFEAQAAQLEAGAEPAVAA